MAGDKQQVFPDFLLLPCQPKIKAVGYENHRRHFIRVLHVKGLQLSGCKKERKVRKAIIASMAVFLVAVFTGCSEFVAQAQDNANALTSDAAVARRNLETAEQNFQVYRRVVFYNGITSDYILSIEGYLAIVVDNDGDLVVTVKTEDGKYLKHYLGLSDNVTYFSEALEPNSVSTKQYRVIFKPSTIIPSIEIK